MMNFARWVINNAFALIHFCAQMQFNTDWLPQSLTECLLGFLSKKKYFWYKKKSALDGSYTHFKQL